MEDKMSQTKDRHHRIPQSLIKGSGMPNVIVRVNAKKHRAWHLLFSNMTPSQICDEINKQWGDPRVTFVAVLRT